MYIISDILKGGNRKRLAIASAFEKRCAAGKVNIFTWPRRLGKTQNMSILKSFFEIGSDKSFIDMADATTRSEIELLVAGKTIRKKIVETLTYGELTENIDNLWSVLFLTGYLTVDRNAPKLDDDLISLVIHNREVREILNEKIQKWFKETQVSGNQKELYDAIWSCDFDDMEADSEKGLRQIQENNYAWPYQRRKYTVLAYGIAFAEKDCCVKVEKM